MYVIYKKVRYGCETQTPSKGMSSRLTPLVVDRNAKSDVTQLAQEFLDTLQTRVGRYASVHVP